MPFPAYLYGKKLIVIAFVAVAALRFFLRPSSASAPSAASPALAAPYALAFAPAPAPAAAE